jgi:hypothetical protein
MSEGLSSQDIQLLQSPLPLDDHEARASGKSKKGDKQQWLIYVTQEGIIPRLNEIDPNWSLEVKETAKWDRYVRVTSKLTIKGVSRDASGGNSPNGSSSPVDENTEKGGETDAFKRAAMRFGVGLYLRSVPAIWVPYSDDAKPWDLEVTAMAEFTKWYNRQFKTGQASQWAEREAKTWAKRETENHGFTNKELLTALDVERLGDWLGSVDEATAKLDAWHKAQLEAAS